jgi:hypothetical protein
MTAALWGQSYREAARQLRTFGVPGECQFENETAQQGVVAVLDTLAYRPSVTVRRRVLVSRRAASAPGS